MPPSNEITAAPGAARSAVDAPVSGEVYGGRFYDYMEAAALRSARHVVPLIVKLLSPLSVIDVGCGTGAWIAAFRENGIRRACGADGAWVDKGRLLFPERDFLAIDLGGPFRLEGSFDLAVSVEVAEHLDAEAGDRLLDALTALAPVVVFSAGIPHQGGVHHTNEQWQGYWIRRFEERGFVAVDCLRPVLWENREVAAYYSQNLFLFVSRDHLPNVPAIEAAYRTLGAAPRNLVHPELWNEVNERSRKAEIRILELERQCRSLLNVEPGSISLKNVLLALPLLTVHALRSRLSGQSQPLAGRPQGRC